MNIFVYSDESGVFDVAHNRIYVYGGVILLGKEHRDIQSRKYHHVERTIRESAGYSIDVELKASMLENKHKAKIYRSLNNVNKFGAIIDQNRVNDNIFAHKKDKQRYLDYVYKISLKHALSNMIHNGSIHPEDVNNIYIFADEHTTATNGRYDLQEGLEAEFKRGTFNYNYHTFFPPLFPDMNSVTVNYRDSSTTTLIRAADIIANKIYHRAIHDYNFKPNNNLLFIKRFP